jgi:hypothetical protein
LLVVAAATPAAWCWCWGWGCCWGCCRCCCCMVMAVGGGAVLTEGSSLKQDSRVYLAVEAVALSCCCCCCCWELRRGNMTCCTADPVQRIIQSNALRGSASLHSRWTCVPPITGQKNQRTPK